MELFFASQGMLGMVHIGSTAGGATDRVRGQAAQRFEAVAGWRSCSAPNSPVSSSSTDQLQGCRLPAEQGRFSAPGLPRQQAAPLQHPFAPFRR